MNRVFLVCSHLRKFRRSQKVVILGMIWFSKYLGQKCPGTKCGNRMVSLDLSFLQLFCDPLPRSLLYSLRIPYELLVLEGLLLH